MSYLKVTKFKEYQHYKNRRPPWVKFYVTLLDPNNPLNAETILTRFLFDRMLLIAASYDNAIPKDSELIAKLAGMKLEDCDEALANLLRGRWLTETRTKRRASKSASTDASDSLSPEAEQSLLVNTPTALNKGEKQKPAHITTGALGTESFAHALRLFASLSNKNDNTKSRILGFAGKLPPAAFETVREKLEQGNGHIKNDGGYACSELDRMVREKQYA